MRKLIVILAWIIFTGSTAFAFPPVMPQAPGVGSGDVATDTIWDAAGDLVQGTGANTAAKLSAGTAGAYLRSAGAGAANVWSTLLLPNAGSAFYLPVFSAANTMTQLAASGTTGQVLTAVTGAIPAWAALPTNSASAAGVVSSGAGQNAQVWKTDAAGVPGWRADATDGGTTMANDAVWAAKGDLAVASANDTGTVLSIGTAYQVLHVNTDTPGWTSTLGATGTRLTKGWFTEVETSNPLKSGVAGTTAGGLILSNATSGTITMSPATGALGTVAITVPATAGTMAVLASGACAAAGCQGFDGTDKFTFFGANSSDLYIRAGSASNVSNIGMTGTGTITFDDAVIMSSTLSIGTSNALTAGTIELGHASDTTLARSSAGVVSVEGVPVTRTIVSGTSALGTGAISSGACATAVTTTATGTVTTDVINWGFNGDPTGVTGYAASANGMLTIIAYPSSANVNYKVCNNTSASITPGAITLNWQVLR